MKNTGKTLMKSGKTKISEVGAYTTRTRKGTTPGGRTYSSTRSKGFGGGTGKETKVTSGSTFWKKSTSPEGDTSRLRATTVHPTFGGYIKEGAKGPTKPKPGYKSGTHTYPDGTKVRSGKTPSGRKYKAVKHSYGTKQTTVGGFTKVTTSGKFGASPIAGREQIGTISNGKRVVKASTSTGKPFKRVIGGKGIN